MRAVYGCVGLLAVAGALATPVDAQRALDAAAAVRSQRPPAPLLTLRPEPGLEALAQEVAAVLELRTGQRVEVGDAPPPDVLEAVPAGHVAMAVHDGAVLLVLGAPGGRSFDAKVELDPQGGASAARAVALAAEDLSDTAVELARRGDETTTPVAVAEEKLAQEPGAARPGGSALPRTLQAVRLQPEQPRDDGESQRGAGLLGGDVDPLVYVRVYGGASTASHSVSSGLGAGLGLCVQGHCLFLAGELPLISPRGDELDVRYRYLTFISGFYTRPFSFGGFTPGASLGFLTRLGHFEADMGFGDSGLDTDLGVRGSLELAFELATGLDLMAEGGVDFTIDRAQLVAGDMLVRRGDQWSPWGQGALRYRP